MKSYMILYCNCWNWNYYRSVREQTWNNHFLMNWLRWWRRNEYNHPWVIPRMTSDFLFFVQYAFRFRFWALTIRTHFRNALISSHFISLLMRVILFERGIYVYIRMPNHTAYTHNIYMNPFPFPLCYYIWEN